MTVLIEIKVPDVGNVAEIDVVEVLIQPGDVVALEQTVATLETDKASMDLPSSAAGTIQQVYIKPGDKVSEGSLIATVLANSEQAGTETPVQHAIAPAEIPVSPPAAEKAPEPVSPPLKQAPEPVMAETVQTTSDPSTPKPHASPSVRLFARELGVDVTRIK